MNKGANVGVVVLAAGESKRLGQPKQLLPYLGTTIIAHVVRTTLASKASKTIVITGAYADRIRDELDCFPVTIIENHSWQDGVATSIGLGIETLEQSDMPQRAVLLMTSDQLRASTKLINLIIDKYDNQPNRIVACEYEETVGVPALFDQAHFPELKSLRGDCGAKNIINNHLEHVVTVAFPGGGLDIDTTRDMEKL